MIRPSRLLRVLTCIVLMLSCAAIAPAAVRLPAVIGDHMVLQRGQPAPIWGWADAGEKVTVRFLGQTKSALPGPDGKWMPAWTPCPPVDPIP